VKVIKVGVVGLGAMGQHHVRLYSELVVIWWGWRTSILNVAQEIGDKYRVPYYSDYRDLLPQVEAVSIAVPTTMHHSVAKDFLSEVSIAWWKNPCF
jgi:UDP-N-acetylglucosamine 3-dehydrogenase